MESKQNDSFESLKKELDDLCCLNSVAIQLYKATESDLEVLTSSRSSATACLFQKILGSRGPMANSLGGVLATTETTLARE